MTGFSKDSKDRIFKDLWSRMCKHPCGSVLSRRYSKRIAYLLTPWEDRQRDIFRTHPSHKSTFQTKVHVEG